MHRAGTIPKPSRISATVAGFQVRHAAPELITNAPRFLADGRTTGQITANVDAVLPLRSAAEAHRRLESREVRGVLVLDPNTEREQTP